MIQVIIAIEPLIWGEMKEDWKGAIGDSIRGENGGEDLSAVFQGNQQSRFHPRDKRSDDDFFTPLSLVTWMCLHHTIGGGRTHCTFSHISTE